MAMICRMDCDCNDSVDIIYKGTTPTFTFKLCFDTKLLDIANTHIVFTSGSAKVDKSGDELQTKDALLACELTQDDTMSFNGGQVNIQILATMKNGQKPASEIVAIAVSETLRGDVW